MLVAPDGKSLFAYDELGRFLRMSTATGRILGSLGVREILAGGGAGEDSLIGVSSDSRVAYLAVDIQGRASRIVEWNFVDGNHTAVIDEEKFVSHRYFRRYITNAGVSRIVSIPGGPHPPPRCRVRVVELPNGVSRELDMPIWESDPDQEGMNISETPCLAPDGRTLYGNGSTDGVVGFDLETGQSLGHAMAQPWRRDRSCAPVISSDGRMLFAGVYDRHVWVRNTAAKEWIARLEVGDQISHLVVSQDDVWIAALGYFAGSPKLLLFDLTPLRALLDKRTP
jgi:hypothetical protein